MGWVALATEAALADEKGPSRAETGQYNLQDRQEAWIKEQLAMPMRG